MNATTKHAGLPLAWKYADPTEDARPVWTLDDYDAIRREDPSLLVDLRLAPAAPALLAALERIHANAAESVEWIRRTADEALRLARGA